MLLVGVVIVPAVHDKERVIVLIVFLAAGFIRDAAYVRYGFQLRFDFGYLIGGQIIEHHADRRRLVGLGEDVLHNGKPLLHFGAVRKIFCPIPVDRNAQRENGTNCRQRKHDGSENAAAVYKKLCKLFHGALPFLTFSVCFIMMNTC